MKIIQSIESEKAVLGGLLLDSSCFLKINKQLCVRDFTVALHQIIFDCMRRLFLKYKKFDASMVCSALDADEIIEKFIYELANTTPSTANIIAYADIVREKSVQRQLVAIAADISNSAKNPNNKSIQDLLDESEDKVRAVNSPQCGYQAHLASFFREVAEEIDSIPREDFCESYLEFILVEVNKAIVDTLRHVEDTHPEEEDETE